MRWNSACSFLACNFADDMKKSQILILFFLCPSTCTCQYKFYGKLQREVSTLQPSCFILWARVLSRVDFPAPGGPSSRVMRPGLMAPLMLSSRMNLCLPGLMPTKLRHACSQYIFHFSTVNVEAKCFLICRACWADANEPQTYLPSIPQFQQCQH